MHWRFIIVLILSIQSTSLFSLKDFIMHIVWFDFSLYRMLSILPFDCFLSQSIKFTENVTNATQLKQRRPTVEGMRSCKQTFFLYMCVTHEQWDKKIVKKVSQMEMKIDTFSWRKLHIFCLLWLLKSRSRLARTHDEADFYQDCSPLSKSHFIELSATWSDRKYSKTDYILRGFNKQFAR